MKLSNKLWYLLFLFIPFLPGLTCHSISPCYQKTQYFKWDTLYCHNLDNSGQYSFESSNQQIPKNAYGIRLYLEKNISTTIQYIPDTCLTFLPDNKITNLRILTLYNFDTEHPAGSDISAYFKVASLPAYESSAYSYNHFSGIQEFLNTDTVQANYNQIDFLMMSAPDTSSTQEFYLEITTAQNIDTLQLTSVNIF